MGALSRHWMGDGRTLGVLRRGAAPAAQLPPDAREAPPMTKTRPTLHGGPRSRPLAAADKQPVKSAANKFVAPVGIKHRAPQFIPALPALGK